MRIEFRTVKPLNHRVWRIIYLICFLFGFCIQGYGEATQTVHRFERVTYQWKLIENIQQWRRTWRVIYGKTQGKEKAQEKPAIVEIPEPQPSPYLAEVQEWRQRRRKHPLAQDFKTSRLAYVVRFKNHRGSHFATPQSPPRKRTLYRPPRPLSLRVAT